MCRLLLGTYSYQEDFYGKDGTPSVGDLPSNCSDRYDPSIDLLPSCLEASFILATLEEIQGSQIRKVHEEIPLAEKEKEKQSWKEF